MDDLRVKFGEMSHEERKAASREREIEEWQAVNRFCGKCGAAMRRHENPDEPAYVCPTCGYMAYPKISPAVIVLVTRGDQVLLVCGVGAGDIPRWERKPGIVRLTWKGNIPWYNEKTDLK